MVSRFALIATTCVAVAAHAAAATVTLRLDRHLLPAAPVTVVFTPTVVDPAATTQPVEETIAATENGARVTLPDGQWELAVKAPDAWHARQFLTVAGDRDVAVDLWPAGAVEGTIATAAKNPPPQVTIRFDGLAATGEALQGESSCPLKKDGTFRCTLPAGRFDLRIRAPRHVSAYQWSRRIAARDALKLGTLTLREGQSIIGRVELPREAAKKTQRTISVTARPAGVLGDDNGPRLFGTQLLPMRVDADARGFFHLDGIAPGAWLLSASSSDGLWSDELQYPVREAAEVELSEPLRLAMPAKVALTLDPPLAPGDQPWSVAVSRVVASRVLSPLGQSYTKSGSWTSPPLRPARYNIAVRANDDVWYSEDVTIAGADASRTLTLRATDVRGLVTLGGKPLRATLTFSAGTRNATASSDDDGHFTVKLPAAPDATNDAWDVHVASKMPLVERSLAHVEPHVAGDGTSELTIALPASLFSGTVVDEKGAPVAHALVSVMPPGSSDPLIQSGTATDGGFELHGLAAGRYAITAETPFEASTPELVEFDGSGIAQPVTIVVHKRVVLRGIVTSDFGPVAGATVIVTPTDAPLLDYRPLTTDARGLFEAQLAPGTKEVDVVTAAPGFAFEIDHAQLTTGKVMIRVTQAGGTLVIRRDAKLTHLMHNGATIPIGLVAMNWPSTEERDGNATLLRLPMMEPGAWNACAVAPAAWEPFRRSLGNGGAPCSGGALDPYGLLALGALHERSSAP